MSTYDKSTSSFIHGVELDTTQAPNWIDAAALQAGIDEVVKRRPPVGRDKMSIHQLVDTTTEELHLICGRLLRGDYKFVAYEQVLVPKRKDTFPRELAIASLRDRAVLAAMKAALHRVVGATLPRRLPNTTIRRFVGRLGTLGPSTYAVVRADIASFYPSIRHEDVLTALHSAGAPESLRLTVRGALRNPTVPRAHGRLANGRSLIGVPQGLPISNLLAEIVARRIDLAHEFSAPLYARYVDDIAIVVPRRDAAASVQSLARTLASIGLSLNTDKTLVVYDEPFQFLGYELALGSDDIRVRAGSRQRLLDQLFSLVSQYKHRHGPFRFLRQSEEEQYARLITLVNRKVSGVLSHKRRLGWLFYYSAITDLTSLYEMDRIIETAVASIAPPAGTEPLRPRSLAKTLHVMRSGRWGDYFEQFDRVLTQEEIIDFLVDEGVEERQVLTRMESSTLLLQFERHREGVLRSMELDAAVDY